MRGENEVLSVKYEAFDSQRVFPGLQYLQDTRTPSRHEDTSGHLATGRTRSSSRLVKHQRYFKYLGFSASLKMPWGGFTESNNFKNIFCLVLFHVPLVYMFALFPLFSFMSSRPLSVGVPAFRSTEFLFHEPFLNACLGSFSPYMFWLFCCCCFSHYPHVCHWSLGWMIT